MALRLNRPSHDELRSLLGDAAEAPLTYTCVGASLDESVPLDSGLKRQTWSAGLSGPAAFDRGVAALKAWEIHRGAGLSVVADGDLAAGTVVAMAAPLPVGFVEITCRVVALIAEPDRFGFAYGTLPIHPERGEEGFVLTRASPGAVFTVRAVSKPVHPLARLAPPIADRLQATATRRYLDAMSKAVS